MKKGDNMKQKHFKLDDLLNKEIKIVAKELKINDSALIRKAVMEFISRYELKKELSKEEKNVS